MNPARENHINDNLKSELINKIVNRIEVMELNQTDAAKLMKTTQPRVSALKQKRFDEFRVDVLIEYAFYMGLQVSLDIH